MVNCVFKGPKGDKGDKGAKGDKGDKGAKGDKGDKGAKGDKGDKGAKGDKGDKGAKGDKGDKGAKGDKGDKGNRGDRGDRGKDGRDGRNGKNGKDGLQGPQGPKGEKGEPTKPQPISCGLILSFNPTSHVLTANLKINNCSIFAKVNMRCDDQPIINKIQNTGQWIVNEILKLDFECELAETNKKIDIVNNNVIDVKSSVVSIKNDLSLISQRVLSLISRVSQISTAINSLAFSISNIQSAINNIISSIANINNVLANIQTNLNLVLTAINTISSNIESILDLIETINTNTENILDCCEEIKDLLTKEPPPLPEFDFIDIICIDCTDPNGPDCPPDATPQEKERGYREREITLDDPMAALQLINDQVALLQRKICPADDDQDCMVLLPDPSLPLTTRGHYLLFSWVLEENPKVSVYQNHTQLRNPIDALRVAGNHWNQYFEPIYKIIGKQFGSYFSEQPAKRPLIEGWFLDVAEANRFFNQMRILTKDTPRENDNPRFPMITNSTVPIVNVGKKIILRKVCYGYYDEGDFKKVHSWHRPKNV